MLRLLFFTLYLIAIPILFTQCSSSVKITEDDRSQLDPNFAGFTGTLLIIRNYDNKLGYNSIDKSTIKAFRKYYKGEFLIISGKDLSNYSDLDKYRFFIKPGFNSHYTGTFNGQSQYSQKTWYYMKDRQTQKEYTTKTYPGYLGLERLPIAFEELRTSKKL